MTEGKGGGGVYNEPNRRARQKSGGSDDPMIERPGDSPPQKPHQLLHSSIIVEEASGVAAAEAIGKIGTDNEEDPDETAGSG